jgi:AmmeMemoRadiSam system protein B
MERANYGVRPSPIAGSWYSNDPASLRREIKGYLDSAEIPPLDGELLALIAPHAGYRYSGPTAGYAYKVIEGKKYDTVMILSPFHQYINASLITSAHTHYQTPLGVVPIDQSFLQEFGDQLDTRGLMLETVLKDSEHSLEIQLPFLQIALNSDFTLIPLMLRTHCLKDIQLITAALLEVIQNRRILLIASTDLSHFHPDPDARQLDQEMLKRIEQLSPAKVLSADAEGTASACGATAVAATLEMAIAQGANKAVILNYMNSGDKSGDYSSVVGYGAVAIVKTGEK